MGGFSSFAVSFSIISVLTGCITAYSDAIGPDGPAALGIGWPIVSAGTLFVAVAMAELASAFPTAGALYHWSALLGGAGWGWLTAATNLVGQVAIVAAIDFGCASELAATLGLSTRASFWLLVAILASHALVNAVSVRLVAWLNDFSASAHILGVVVLVGALLCWGRSQPVSFLAHGGFTTRADGNATLGFANGLVLSMFTFTGYDASAHLAEETHDPARRTPWGILTSVGVSAIAGYLLLAAITLAIRDLPAIAGDGHAALAVMRGALGEGFGRGAMALAIAAMWLCGLSAIAIATVGPLLLVLGTSPFSDALFGAMAKMATMALYVSYALPILLGARARQRGTWKTMGPFRAGRHGVVVAWVAVAWSVVVLAVCSLPPNQLPAAMLVGAELVLGVVYFAFVRRRFEGPRVTLAILESGESRD